MKLTNYALVNIMNTLSSFENKKLPQRISYAIMRNLTIVSSDCQLYSKQLNKLIETYKPYAVLDDKGQMRQDKHGLPLIKQEKRAEFNGQVSELLNIEVDCNLYQIDLKLFDYDDGDKYDPLSPQEIFALQAILCADEDKKAEETDE